MFSGRDSNLENASICLQSVNFHLKFGLMMMDFWNLHDKSLPTQSNLVVIARRKAEKGSGNSIQIAQV